MNTNSGFYRFLCFYESIHYGEEERTRRRKEAGQELRRFRDVIPATQGEFIALLQDVYPWRKQWDRFALDQMIPLEASGKKIGWAREKYLNQLRIGIAHALLQTGELTMTFDDLEHVQQDNRWLPLISNACTSSAAQ